MAGLISADAAGVIEKLASVLDEGGTVVFPTDTVYALAALPGHAQAITRIFELKMRPPEMHLTTLLSDMAQVPLVSRDDRAGPRALMREFWPGQVTLVLPHATPLVEGLGADDGTVGARCPDYPLARALAARVGPVATTSANVHGAPTPATAREVSVQLPEVDLVVDAGKPLEGTPSTVVDVTGAAPHVLRAGAVAADQLMAAWPAATG